MSGRLSLATGEYLLDSQMAPRPGAGAGGAISGPGDFGSALALWLDSSDSGSYTVDGSGLVILRDKSGNNRHFTRQGGTGWSQTTRNGRNAFLYAGQPLILLGGGGAGQILGTRTMTICLACRPSNNTNHGFIQGLFGNNNFDAASNGFSIAHADNNPTDNTISSYFTNGTDFAGSICYQQTANGTSDATVHQLITVTYDPTAGAASRGLLRLNGGAVTAAANDRTGAPTQTTPGSLFIGTVGSVTYNSPGMILDELVCVEGVVGATPLGQLESYMMSRWALP